AAAFAKVRRDIEDLEPIFDARGIRRRAPVPAEPADVSAFEEITGRLNALYRELRLVRAFLSAFTSTDARNDAAQSRASDLRASHAPLAQPETRCTAWLGSLAADTVIAASPVAREHEFVIRRSAVLARHQMSEGEEALAAALLPAGLSGWARLHRDLTA